METANMELKRISEELEKLRLEKQYLEQLRDAKMEAIRLKIGNIPASFQAQHPIFSSVAGYTGKAAASTGKTFAKGIKAYLHYLDERNRQPMKPMPKQKALA